MGASTQYRFQGNPAGGKKESGLSGQKGFNLVDKDGNEVDPYSVDWSKYSKGIPYRVVQEVEWGC